MQHWEKEKEGGGRREIGRERERERTADGRVRQGMTARRKEGRERADGREGMGEKARRGERKSGMKFGRQD